MVAAVNPGDAVYIQPGNYTEAIKLTHSGTADKPIIAVKKDA